MSIGVMGDSDTWNILTPFLQLFQTPSAAYYKVEGDIAHFFFYRNVTKEPTVWIGWKQSGESQHHQSWKQY